MQKIHPHRFRAIRGMRPSPGAAIPEPATAHDLSRGLQSSSTPPKHSGFRAIPRSCPLLLILLSCLFTAHPLAARASSVVIYTSQDEEYADPTFREFERETGIKILPVYDSEAVKTVGLVNRLLHEQNHPQCDVFWNNEEMRTRMLAARGLFRETNGWVLTGWRSRRLVVNTNLLPVAQAPRTFAEATNAIWRGKFALAYPLFGTTATHFQVLRQHSGDAAWQAWCRALNANKPMLVDGNSVVVKLVGGGEASFGFTDSDDIAGGQQEGMPIVAMPLADDSLLVHNTLGLLRGAPHPVEAQRLFDYLQSKPVLDRLFQAHAVESESAAIASDDPGLKVDWDSLLRDLDPTTAELQDIFLR
jgi:iron(III) transport system substrate-binding protein